MQLVGTGPPRMLRSTGESEPAPSRMLIGQGMTSLLAKILPLSIVSSRVEVFGLVGSAKRSLSASQLTHSESRPLEGSRTRQIACGGERLGGIDRKVDRR